MIQECAYPDQYVLIKTHKGCYSIKSNKKKSNQDQNHPDHGLTNPNPANTGETKPIWQNQFGFAQSSSESNPGDTTYKGNAVNS